MAERNHHMRVNDVTEARNSADGAGVNAAPDVTAVTDVTGVTAVTDSSAASSAREKTRDRVRRHRAARKQAEAIRFVRTDAGLFLHPDRLSQKAGAPKHHLRRMALKELVDNALDAAATATLTELDIDTFIVADDGPGLDPQRVVELFSITRPMMSTKLVRRPTRGMVGNGLRVATGAAFASGGGLVVESRGIRQTLSFDRATGETVVASRENCTVATGTTITIRFGSGLPADPSATAWADTAIMLAGEACRPMLTHPSWYSQEAFEELVDAAPHATARDLSALFGIDLGNAFDPVIEQGQSNPPVRYIPDPDGPASGVSLDMLKALAPKPPKLIPIAEDLFRGVCRMERTEVSVGGATVPAIVQGWARQCSNRNGGVSVSLIVNRTVIAADIAIYVGGDAWMKGCGLPPTSIGTVPKGDYDLTIAITTPAVALISDGKTPDLMPFRECLASTIGPALRRAHRPKSRGWTIKDAACDVMEEAYLKASAGGTLPANARQIMYAARPQILERTGQDRLNDAYFTQTLLPAFMDDNPDITADWDVVYDARGHLVEPHTGDSLPLGTLHVREYLRRQPRMDDTALVATTAGLHATVGPGDRYGAVLFIEKEGFEPLLRAARIAERFDVAVMSTKGMSVIAARALVDRLSADGIRIIVAHDLDLAGIRIFGTLGSDSSRYRFTHEPDVRRLGLTLEQAEAMDLQSERQEVQGDHERLLAGMRKYGATHAEQMFIAGGQRVELNAMPSDQFVAWIERGLRDHGAEKVIPPRATIEQRARQIIGMQHVALDIAALEKSARQHAATVALPADLAERMRQEFIRNPALPWEDALAQALES